jgi:hypothetical protein
MEFLVEANARLRAMIAQNEDAREGTLSRGLALNFRGYCPGRLLNGF